MRTAIIIIDGKPQGSVGNPVETRELYKRLLTDPKSKFEEIELWESNSGRVKMDNRLKREAHARRLEDLAKAEAKAKEDADKPAPKAKAEAKAKGSDSKE
jgi:hypothetical protein